MDLNQDKDYSKILLKYAINDIKNISIKIIKLIKVSF